MFASGVAVVAFVLCLWSVQADDCLVNPANSTCASYVYPDKQAIADVTQNCYQMPWMIGCSVWNACQAGKMPDNSPYCEPFSVLGDICIDSDMAGMPGCKGWRILCASDASVVQQCDTMKPIPRVVTTTASQKAIVASCSDHNMQGCEDCTGLYNQCADTLHTLQTLCSEMKMEMCNDYNAMCTAGGADLAYFCSTKSGSYDPAMKMYFHGGITDIILFRGWVPRSGGEYFGAVLACLFAGMLVSAIRAYRACAEAYYRIRDNLHIRHMPHEVSNSNIFALDKMRVGPHVIRSIVTFFMVTIDYSLMLAAMSFNVGIFISICAGLALGMFFFGHIPDRYSQRLQANAILSSDVECGCGTMISNNSKHQNYEPATDVVVVGTQPSPPDAGGQPASCCGNALSSFDSSSSMHQRERLLDSSSEEAVPGARAQFRGKICCSMKPILDVEEDAQQSSVDQAGSMVPTCCRL